MSVKKSKQEGLKYIGGGFIPGVPARDLTADEVAQHGGEEQLIRSQLYVKHTKKPGPSQTKQSAGPSMSKGR